MSFSGQVKEELIKQVPAARHCQLAELAAILQYGGLFTVKRRALPAGSYICELGLKRNSENPTLLRKCFTLLEKTFNIKANIVEESDNLPDLSEEDIDRILASIKVKRQALFEHPETTVSDSILLKSQCCKRAFLRGVFLASGSMSNPEKSYHMEFVCLAEEQAQQVQEMIAAFDVEAKIVLRKKYYVVYLKEGEGIVELLNVMGAHVALMNFENFRILKEMRNDINRRVNCEAANITKTVNASSKQIEDIEYIRVHYGFQKLSDSLRQMAEVRLEYPEATLRELGEYLNPTVGKSGVNHRLRKLSELADRLRQ